MNIKKFVFITIASLTVFFYFAIFVIDTLNLNNRNATPQPILTPILGKTVLLTSVNPPPDPTGKQGHSSLLRVQFNFDKILDPGSLRVDVSPYVLMKSEFNSERKQITIYPDTPYYWRPGVVYTIKIHQGLKAIDGTELKEDIEYQFKTKLQGGI